MAQNYHWHVGERSAETSGSCLTPTPSLFVDNASQPLQAVDTIVVLDQIPEPGDKKHLITYA